MFVCRNYNTDKYNTQTTTPSMITQTMSIRTIVSNYKGYPQSCTTNYLP